MRGKAPDNGALTLPEWPALMLRAGAAAQERFLEFFAATIRNKNTRAAYFRAVCRFLKWADERNLDLEDIRPVHVAAYVEAFTAEAFTAEAFTAEEQDSGLPFSPSTIKQHLAAIKMLFGYLVAGQILPFNPAAAVRGPRYSTKRGKTPVLSAAEAKKLIASIDISTVVGLRDRALIGLMLYSFSRVSAVVGMRVADLFVQGRRTWIRLSEKGGKNHEVPVHHLAQKYLRTYLDAAGIRNAPDSRLWRSTRGRSHRLTVKGMTRVDAYRMIQRRAAKAGMDAAMGCHTFRATGITVFLENGGVIETAAQIAAHVSTRTTKLYDRRNDRVALKEIERIRL
ncbi:MAG TPA: tyrosine-type recombinase/integrase [Luteolibacter sp.]